jgi:hypothetical protein
MHDGHYLFRHLALHLHLPPLLHKRGPQHWSPSGYIYGFSGFAFVLSMLIIMFANASRSHKHIYDVTNLLLFFWIKMFLNF